MSEGFLTQAVTTITDVPQAFYVYETDNFLYLLTSEGYDAVENVPAGSVRRQSEAFNYAVLVVRKADRTVTKARWF